ncbi:uncharacterized protein METZ01_LOCUS354748 [marine metagenome]|uniref:Uncharacterized protein n=1 Tax=marine metagenome TaxID=408172 RepID=A0A382RW22_9ZZZZ
MSDKLRENFNLCVVDTLTEEQLLNSIALYEYHTRRILAERSRLETEEMLRNMKQAADALLRLRRTKRTKI